MIPDSQKTRSTNLKKKRKLDGVGPVDNRPSTDKIHHFVKKKKLKNYM